MSSSLAPVVPKSAYVVAFALTALACFGAVRRARRIDDGGIRRGLTGLLVVSGLWAGAHVGRLVAPTVPLKTALYTLGLAVGFASVGAWLYLCSAYTGRRYHRDPTVRRVAVGVYLAVVAVKFTNPLHGEYFSARVAAEPFAHLVIVQGSLHWIFTTVAYSLSAVGFYLLFDLYLGSDQDTTVLSVLVSLTAVPVLLDVLGYLTPAVLELNYEPVGVALFALGVLYATEESFLAVPRFGRRQVIEGLGDPVLLLDSAGTVREANRVAERTFPGVADGVGDPLADALPGVAAALAAGDQVVEHEVDGATRHFLVREVPLSVGGADLGCGLVFNDVTAIENHRRELRRQNEQLDEFAEAVNHELRNALNIVAGYLELAGRGIDEEDPDRAAGAIERADASTERMTRVVDDLSALARYGQTVERTAECSFPAAVRSAWEGVETDGLALHTEGEGWVLAGPDRLTELFQTAFEFARENGASTVEVALGVGEGEMTVRDDGWPVDGSDPERLFAYGEAVPDAESGMLLPTVRMLARVHGWDVELAEGYREGVELRVTGVTAGREPAEGPPAADPADANGLRPGAQTGP